MRNQMFYSVLGMAVLFLVNGCQKPVNEAPVLELGQTTVTIGSTGGSGSVSYKVTNPVEGTKPTAKAEANDWVSDIAVTDAAITFNVAANPETAARSVKVTVSYPNAADAEFTISQSATELFPAIVLENKEFTAPAEGGSCSVNYSIENPVDGQSLKAELLQETSWLSNLNVSSTAITFDVASNTVEESRSASITLTYEGAISVDLKVTQEPAAPVEYKVNPNWTVSYEGKDWDETTPVEVFSVNVASGTDGFLVGTIPVSEFVDIETFVEGMIAAYQEQIDYYNEYGYPISWSDILSTESGYFAFDLLDASVEWYAIVFGVSDAGRATGLYAVSDAFVPELPEASEAYNKWLGNWRIEDANGVGYDIVLSEEIGDMTYLMNGWEPGILTDNQGQPVQTPVRVNFEPETGNLVFVPNEFIEDLTINVTVSGGGSDVCALCFYGIDNSEGYYWPGSEYTMGHAVMDAGETSATVTGEDFVVEGQSFTMGSMCMFLISIQGDSAYLASNSNTVPQFPLTMTRQGTSSTSISSVSGNANSAKMQIIESPVRFGPKAESVVSRSNVVKL